jgi:hypothetical protein
MLNEVIMCDNYEEASKHASGVAGCTEYHYTKTYDTNNHVVHSINMKGPSTLDSELSPAFSSNSYDVKLVTKGNATVDNLTEPAAATTNEHAAIAYESGYSHGCSDARSERYINQPGKGTTSHTSSFMHLCKSLFTAIILAYVLLLRAAC